MKKLNAKNQEILNELATGWKSNYSTELPNLKPSFFNNVGELESVKNFYNIVQNEISNYLSNDQFDYVSLSQILIAIAIDSESVQVEDMIESSFKGKNLMDLIIMGLAHPWKDVRWQVLEILGRSTIENKASLLFYALSKENHTYVLRVGLKILSEVNLVLAKEIAGKHLESEDSYLRILSKDIAELP